MELPKFHVTSSSGDALSSNGNINNRPTVVKTDYLPYGVDFIGGPTGRSTNNRTLVDVITQYVGFDSFIPPFANASGEEILKGVNYASYGGGILNQTGKNLGATISLDNQLSNHMTTISSIRLLMRNNKTAADEYLSKCLYSVEVGTDDYINNYFLSDNNRTRSNFNQDQFANLLVQQYTQQLKRLYSYGATKIAVFGLDLIALAPAVIAQYGVGSAAVATATELFTNKLPTLVNKLNNGLPGAKFTYINVGAIRSTSPRLLGLINIGSCCKVMDVLYTCVKGVPPCPNRDLYAFFDGYHPTDKSNAVQAERVYIKTLPTDASPYDIRTLVHL